MPTRKTRRSCRDLVEPVVSRGGVVLFVQLTCTIESLFERVQDESRQVYDKITDAPVLQDVRRRYDLFTAIPFGDSLRVDTSDLPPSQAAASIAAHYLLPVTLQRDAIDVTDAPL